VPDLLTHATAGYLISRGLLKDHRIAYFVLGSVIPDVMTRIPGILFQRFIGLPVAHFFDAYHTPAAFFISAYLICFMFPERERLTAFSCISSGALLHFVFDLLQEQFYLPIYMPYFPFNFDTIQWPLFHIHASLFIAPVLLLLTFFFARKP
jgi:hypothetical protein